MLIQSWVLKLQLLTALPVGTAINALPAICVGMTNISERQRTTTYAHALTQQVKTNQRMTYKI